MGWTLTNLQHLSVKFRYVRKMNTSYEGKISVGIKLICNLYNYLRSVHKWGSFLHGGNAGSLERGKRKLGEG
jgi:hypothetical protein